MSLDTYVIGKIIGKGSYGEVSLVKHRKDRKQYVIKKVNLQKASSRERKAAELEAKLLSQLRHPNIVSYRESFQDNDGFLFIVMNFCEGGDLYTKLKSQKGQLLEETQIVEWFVQIAMALQYMHERHILHRDLKTQNIFLTKSGIIKVGDLGIARVLESSDDMARTLIGTPYYMSPELFSNKPYNHKSDVWALGCVLYETCTLRPAFNARDMNSLVYKILKGKIPSMPKQYSNDLCTIIKTMLEQEPEKRPSVSRLLRHPYIKKQIALFLEGTKSRQKQRRSSSNRMEKRSVEISPTKKNNSAKSDSGYGESNHQSSIATVSAVDCVLSEDPTPCGKPAKESPRQSDSGRASVESTSSSGSSEKGQTEIYIGRPHSGGVKKAGPETKVVNNDKKLVGEKQNVEAKRGLTQEERRKELIKKQMQEKRRQAIAEKAARRDANCIEKEVKEQKRSEVKGRFRVERNETPGEEKPVRKRPRSGENRKSDDLHLPNEIDFERVMTSERNHSPQMHSRFQRPLPKPPGSPLGEVPLSKSPRARRRYKVASVQVKSHTAEEEEEERSSIDSDRSDRSSVSVSESTPQSACGLTARERRRLKQKQKTAGMSSPPIVQVLPSPREVLAARASHIQAAQTPPIAGAAFEPRATPSTGSVSVEPRRQLVAGARDMPDGPRRGSQTESLDPDDGDSSDSTGSELEEISLDEPAPAQKSRKRRKESDVSCLISALDTTLKLATPDRDSPENDEEEEEDEVMEERAVGVDVPDGSSPTTSGRLRDRIERLRSRKRRKESDVSCLISALDTTLKLATPDRDSPENDEEEEEDEVMEERAVDVDVPDGSSPTTSGRLRDRIERLRSECIRGIGVDVLRRAYNIIDNENEDNVEEALVRLMGRENFERYGGPIWQLKFCESFR